MLPLVYQTTSLLMHSRYILLFPAVLVEGPVATIIAGLLVAHSQLDFPLSLITIVSADTLADLGYYTIGAFGEASVAQRIKTRLGITPDRLANLKDSFYRHSIKAFLAGKVIHGPGIIVLIAAGAARVSLLRYFLVNLSITLIKSFLLLLVGYYFGQALGLLQHWLDLSSLIASSIVIVVAITFIIRHKRYKKI